MPRSSRRRGLSPLCRQTRRRSAAHCRSADGGSSRSSARTTANGSFALATNNLRTCERRHVRHSPQADGRRRCPICRTTRRMLDATRRMQDATRIAHAADCETEHAKYSPTLECVHSSAATAQASGCGAGFHVACRLLSVGHSARRKIKRAQQQAPWPPSRDVRAHCVCVSHAHRRPVCVCVCVGGGGVDL